MGEHVRSHGRLDPGDARFAVVASRYNEEITARLLDGALDALHRHGVDDGRIRVVWVPGAFELPLVAKRCARSRHFDAIIALGAVIRGDTAHFDYVAGQAAQGLTQAALDTGVPGGFGGLTTDDKGAARVRAGGAKGNKGEEAAPTAIGMVDLLRQLPSPSDEGT